MHRFYYTPGDPRFKCFSVLYEQRARGYTNLAKAGETKMAKKGMKRPETTHTQPRNDAPPVPEIQGKAKHTKEKAKPVTEP